MLNFRAAIHLLVAGWGALPACDLGPAGVDGDSEIIWRAPIRGLFFGEPSADQERIYLAVRDSLLALDQRTGERVWGVVPAGSEIQTATLPLVDGQLYVLNGGAVHTYDPRTGVRIRTSPLEPRIGFDFGGSGLEIGRDRMYVAQQIDPLGALYALDRASGAVLWHRLLSPQPARITEAGDRVCVGLNSPEPPETGVPQGSVVCLSGSDGRVLWRFDVPFEVDGVPVFCQNGGVSAKPAVAGDRLIIGDQCGQLFALDLGTGAIVWRKLYDTAWDSEVIIDNGIGYACERSFGCTAFRIDDGMELWRTFTAGSVHDPPRIVSGSLYAIACCGILYKFDPSSGAVLAELESGDEEGFFSSPPVFRDGMVFTGGGRIFYALRAP